ncbi:MAG: NlpC/P60 family protein, partial [Nocardioidaceae bacterium]
WDCSGLTMGAWASAGVYLPHYSVAQYAATTPDHVRPAPPRRPRLLGEQLLATPARSSTSGLYIGNGDMIHAARTGVPVKVESIWYWETRTSSAGLDLGWLRDPDRGSPCWRTSVRVWHPFAMTAAAEPLPSPDPALLAGYLDAPYADVADEDAGRARQAAPQILDQQIDAGLRTSSARPCSRPCSTWPSGWAHGHRVPRRSTGRRRHRCLDRRHPGAGLLRPFVDGEGGVAVRSLRRCRSGTSAPSATTSATSQT